ncbi:hypothetical protein [Stenotrophomonas chelatiphaga]|uniref:hypothetical protein n=1 Tax=Stenotrophomonas chelatiphaga TaxID=517011 RepID=UPI003D12216E
MEVHRINDSFIDVSGIPEVVDFARQFPTQVHCWSGIPNCIGVASTKTLAKMANKLAKSGDGVQNVSGPIRRRTPQLPGPNPAQSDARLGR